MQIIILGAGRVGSTLASNLSHEPIDITLIDTNQDALDSLNERLDVATVCGNAAHPNILESAGIRQADIIIAATDSDETNMMACQVAHHLFNVPKKIARVRSQAYMQNQQALFNPQAIPIDSIINPEQEVVNFIKQLILHPGSQQVLSFAEGAANLVEVRIRHNNPVIGLSLKDLNNKLNGEMARIAAIYRKDSVIFPKYETIIEEEDRLFFIAASDTIQYVLSTLFNESRPHKRIVIAGGGRVGLGLSKALEEQLQVKIITKNPKRAHSLSEELDHTIVLLGDASDESLLLDENIEKTDVFCAVTSDDESNILCSMLAKSLGAKVVMSIVDRNAYMSMVDNGSIDNAIYPQHTTIGRILSQIRHGEVAHVHSLLRGEAEAYEAIVLGPESESHLIGKSIQKVKLANSVAIVGLVRNGQSIPAKGSTIIEENDHLILFIADKKQIHAVENLFKPRKSIFKRLVG